MGSSMGIMCTSLGRREWLELGWRRGGGGSCDGRAVEANGENYLFPELQQLMRVST